MIHQWNDVPCAKGLFLNEDNKKLPDKFRWIMRTSCRWTNVDCEPFICSFSIFWAVKFWTGILDIRDGMIPPLTQKKYMFSRWFHPIVHWHMHIYIYICICVYVYIYIYTSTLHCRGKNGRSKKIGQTNQKMIHFVPNMFVSGKSQHYGRVHKP